MAAKPAASKASAAPANASGLNFGSYGSAADIPAPQPDASASAEVYQLQRTLATVLKENKALKDEVRGLQVKLDSIKKLAA